MPAPPPSAVPLTGADCFLRAFDGEIRRMCGANHVSQLVLRLGPGFDPGRLEKLLEEAACAQPILRAPIRRRLGFGAPVYRTASRLRRARPRIEVHEAAGPPGPIPALFSERLNQPLGRGRGELLRFDAVRYDGGAAGTDLAASWLHLLFDGAGSERFVRWLDECFRGERSTAELPDPEEFSAPREPRPGARERGDAALAWKHWLDSLGARPLRSLAGPLRRTPQALRYDLLVLEPDATERAVERASQQAGFLTPMLCYLAAAIRAHHAVFRARGIDPGSYVVPLPVNLRPRGAEGAIFRTHVSLLWFQVLPEQVDDFEGLVAVLKRQRLEAIRAGRIESGVYAMDFARWAPARLYARLARSAQRGELCSFFFAYTGEFLDGLDQFLGAPIRGGFHVPPVPPSPGSCLAVSRQGGRLHASHVFQQGVFNEEERALFGAQLRADLLGTGAE